MDAGDDCAVVGSDQAVTVDTLVEGVHFDHRLSPMDIGYKAVAVSVSDLAAMGAMPQWLLLGLSLPRTGVQGWATAFSEGLVEACDRFGVHLVGGDVTRVPDGAPRVVSTTVAGRVPDPPLTRSGARPGDRIWVTGTPGLAGAGWMLDDPPAPALAALRRPRPPLAFAVAAARRGWVTAAMDLSDGPMADLPRLAAASGVQAVLDPDALPVPEGLARHPALRRAQLCGGDDYQLLFTAPDSADSAIETLAAEHDVRATAVGRIREGAGAVLASGVWPTPVFAHFAPDGAP